MERLELYENSTELAKDLLSFLYDIDLDKDSAEKFSNIEEINPLESYIFQIDKFIESTDDLSLIAISLGMSIEISDHIEYINNLITNFQSFIVVIQQEKWSYEKIKDWLNPDPDNTDRSIRLIEEYNSRL